MGQAKRNPHTAPPGDLVRNITLELWRSVREDWKRSDDLIARAFRQSPELNDGQRDQIVTAFHNMVVAQRKIDYALDSLNLPPETIRHRTTLAYTAYLLFKRWMKPEAACKETPEIPWFDPAAIEAAIAAEPDPARRMGLTHGLPDFLAARLIAYYGDGADTLAAALGQRGPQTLRVNTLKTTREQLQKTLAKDEVTTLPTPNALTGLTLTRRINAFQRPEFGDGLFEVQDESSQLAAEAVAPPPGGLVIDFCAGAGGKTLAVGALMKNKGRLIALDTQAFKLTELRKRIARAGLSNAQALTMGETTWPPEVEALKGKAHRVLVDVPCSGTGSLRRNPEGRWRLSEEDLTRLPALQLSIARRAMSLVAPGGRLVYATCSIMREENEGVIEQLLAESAAAGGAGGADGSNTGVWELVLMKEILGGKRAAPICDPGGKYLKLLPSVQGCDGFFAAVLRRKELPAAPPADATTTTVADPTAATPGADGDSAQT